MTERAKHYDHELQKALSVAHSDLKLSHEEFFEITDNLITQVEAQREAINMNRREAGLPPLD